MVEKYTKSRELGRAKPKEVPLPEEEVASIVDIIDTKVENAEIEGEFFWLNGYIGDAKEAVIIKSDIYPQIKNLEDLTKKKVVGIVIMNEGSVQILMESEGRR